MTRATFRTKPVWAAVACTACPYAVFVMGFVTHVINGTEDTRL